MKLTFYIPEKINEHPVTGALVIGAEHSILRNEEILEIEGSRGVKVVLLITPEEEDNAKHYVAFEFNGEEWNQVDIPIYAFEEILTQRKSPTFEEVRRRIVPTT